MFSSPLSIPIVAIIGGLAIAAIAIFLGHKEKMKKLEVAKGQGSDAEFTELRRRIEALEAIVTDDREQLKRKIDSL